MIWVVLTVLKALEKLEDLMERTILKAHLMPTYHMKSSLTYRKSLNLDKPEKILKKKVMNLMTLMLNLAKTLIK